MPETLYVFIDESGNFDFSPNGTRHFVMSAVYTTRPEQSAHQMSSLKYQLLSEGVDIPSFHATNDSQYVRDHVFSLIYECQTISAEIVSVNKDDLPDEMKSSAKLFTASGYLILQNLLQNQDLENIKRIVVIFDQTLQKRDLESFLKIIKPCLNRLEIPYIICMHSMKTEFNGQIADYISWSYFVSLERGEMRPLTLLKKRKLITNYQLLDR